MNFFRVLVFERPKLMQKKIGSDIEDVSDNR